jgi:hypothetical protein
MPRPSMKCCQAQPRHTSWACRIEGRQGCLPQLTPDGIALHARQQCRGGPLSSSGLSWCGAVPCCGIPPSFLCLAAVPMSCRIAWDGLTGRHGRPNVAVNPSGVWTGGAVFPRWARYAAAVSWLATADACPGRRRWLCGRWGREAWCKWTNLLRSGRFRSGVGFVCASPGHSPSGNPLCAACAFRVGNSGSEMPEGARGARRQSPGRSWMPS